MGKLDELVLIPTDRIDQSILIIRGHKVILDEDLAKLYQVTTSVLVQAVKRNLKRFPKDFMVRNILLAVARKISRPGLNCFAW